MKSYTIDSNLLVKIKEMLRLNPAKTIVEAVLDSNSGQVEYVYESELESVLLKISDFIIIEGKISSHSSRYLQYVRPSMEIISSNRQWYDFFIKKYEGRMYLKNRCIFSSHKVPLENLNALLKNLPRHYELLKIDENIGKVLKNYPWSKDLVSNFDNMEDFMEKGVGFCLKVNNEIVSGASSFSRLNNGIEVEIDTNPLHRKKGYATIVGAKLVKYCLENNLTPHWDAMNSISCKIAQKLGYELEKEYEVLFIE